MRDKRFNNPDKLKENRERVQIMKMTQDLKEKMGEWYVIGDSDMLAELPSTKDQTLN